MVGINKRKNQFIFIHIMKTGGTSLVDELMKLGGELFRDRNHKVDKRQTNVKRNKAGGLFKISKADSIYNPGYEKAFIIAGHFTIEKYKHLNRPTFTFLRDPIARVISHYSVNHRKFLKKPNEEPRDDFVEFCKETSNIMTHMTGGDLSKFVFVGITEKYHESLKRLSKILKCRLNERKANKSKIKIKPRKKHIQIIKQYNKEDIKLYEEALKLFNKKKGE